MIDMNLDNLWRHPLQSPETNNAITKTAFEIAKNIVKTSVDYRVLNENSLNKFETAQKTATNKFIYGGEAMIFLLHRLKKMIKDILAMIQNMRISKIYLTQNPWPRH